MLALARASGELAGWQWATRGRIPSEPHCHPLKSHLPLSLTSSYGAEKMYPATSPIPDSAMGFQDNIEALRWDIEVKVRAPIYANPTIYGEHRDCDTDMAGGISRIKQARPWCGSPATRAERGSSGRRDD